MRQISAFLFIRKLVQNVLLSRFEFFHGKIDYLQEEIRL